MVNLAFLLRFQGYTGLFELVVLLYFRSLDNEHKLTFTATFTNNHDFDITLFWALTSRQQWRGFGHISEQSARTNHGSSLFARIKLILKVVITDQISFEASLDSL